jgi:uncharacterized membrane protein YedE/YeeE
VGAVLALLGSAGLSALVWMTYDHSRAAERMLFGLGFGLTGLASALAQGLILFGLWLLWSAGRPVDR